MELFNQFMHIYFWVFIVFIILTFMIVNTMEYKEYKQNGITNGTYFRGLMNLGEIIGTVIWIMSFKY